MIKTIFVIAIAGAIGSVLRYVSSVLINKYWFFNFPIATLLINILGCFLIGFLTTFLANYFVLHQNLKWFLITGFCGGYTTFSAFGLESIRLMQNQNYFLLFLNIGLSVFFGLMAVWLGLFVGKQPL